MTLKSYSKHCPSLHRGDRASPQESSENREGSTRLWLRDRRCQPDTRWCPLAWPTRFLYLGKEAKKVNSNGRKKPLEVNKERVTGFLSLWDAIAKRRTSHRWAGISNSESCLAHRTHTHWGTERVVHTEPTQENHWLVALTEMLLGCLPRSLMPSTQTGETSLFSIKQDWRDWGARRSVQIGKACRLPSKDLLPLQVEKSSFKPVKYAMLQVPLWWRIECGLWG